MSKGSTALGILHEYDEECEVLKTLLAQRVWRRGKRGAWYDRLALVLMNHYGGDLDKKREAVEVCLDGLEDNDTHLSEHDTISLTRRPSVADRDDHLSSLSPSTLSPTEATGETTRVVERGTSYMRGRSWAARKTFLESSSH